MRFCFCPPDDASHTNFVSQRPASLQEIRYEEACNRLAVEAVRRGCTDNVTVMIVDITSRAGGQEVVSAAASNSGNTTPIAS